TGAPDELHSIRRRLGSAKHGAHVVRHRLAREDNGDISQHGERGHGEGSTRPVVHDDHRTARYRIEFSNHASILPVRRTTPTPGARQVTGHCWTSAPHSVTAAPGDGVTRKPCRCSIPATT